MSNLPDGVTQSQIDRYYEEEGPEFWTHESCREDAALDRLAALEPADLTFAAEDLGRGEDHHMIRRALMPLLDHASAVVREGAIYGLTRHLTPEVCARLRDMAATDPSPGVRDAATEALEGTA